MPKNTSREIDHSQVEAILMDYMQELTEGGYPYNIREEILVAGMKGYARMWELQCNKLGHVNRPGKATQQKRRVQKLIGQSTWFKTTSKTKPTTKPPSNQKKTQCRKTQTRVEGILFCPYTKNSKLKKELQSVEEFMNGKNKTGKIRIVERAGPKLNTLLCNKTPWKKEWCGRDNCPPCKTKPGSCRTLNPIYRISCIECAKIGRKVQYIGESSRSFWDRARDHAQALEAKNTKYAITKHWLNDHIEKEDPPDFKFEIIASKPSAIARQITEGLEIENADPSTLINSKGEYGSNRIPRFKLTLEDEIINKEPKFPNPDIQQNRTPEQDATNSKRDISSNSSFFDLQYRQRKRARVEATACTESTASSAEPPPVVTKPGLFDQKIEGHSSYTPPGLSLKTQKSDFDTNLTCNKLIFPRLRGETSSRKAKYNTKRSRD